jgi:cytochrome bd-type quinol oxidase subunit 2
MLFLFTWDESNRRRMLAGTSAVWDGNELWQVLTGTIWSRLFREFALTLSALYFCALIQ